MSRMYSSVVLIAVVAASAVILAGAERKWQTGVWTDISTKRRIVDFGPGSSGFGRPGGTPQMRAMADVRRFVIETNVLRLELEDLVAVGRRSFDAMIGETVTFAVEKNAVFIRGLDGTEHKLRLIKKSDRAREDSTQKTPGYEAIGAGHVVRAVTDGGRYVTLEDGSKWEIAPRDHYQTVDWEASANVTVRTLAEPESGFRYELINTSVDQGAVANYLR